MLVPCTVGCSLLHQSVIKKAPPPDMPTGNPSTVRVPLPRQLIFLSRKKKYPLAGILVYTIKRRLCLRHLLIGLIKRLMVSNNAGENRLDFRAEREKLGGGI